MTAQTTKERQEALRARRLMLGETEVRGIYLPLELHGELKMMARNLSEGWKLHLARYRKPTDER
jgi:hypothetical protein